MTRVLKSKRIEPKSGEVRSVVVFLHGYGANGDDLLGLAEPLSEHLPDTLFVSPDAPENCTGSPLGFQWFPIPCLLYTSPSPRDVEESRMPSSA